MPIWKEVPGWEGVYAISNDGEVKRLAGSPQCNEDRVLKKTISTSGYFYISFTRPGFRKRMFIHRLVALAFMEESPSEKHEINHINGVKTDNRTENLEWVTRSQNIQHAYDTGLHPIQSGTKAANAKFSKEDLAKIVELADGGFKPREIAAKMLVPCRAVIDFLYGRTYINFPRPTTPKALKGARSLDREKVLQIKLLLAEESLSARQIAQCVGVSMSAVQHIKQGRTWKNVTA